MMCQCRFCQYTYHSELGDPTFGIEPGTTPDEFYLGMCPQCNSQVNQFYICFGD
ncbi:MAG: rubredoxin [Methanobacteriaceae archaeon]|nr:rubredoxin [Methanobacteriaceae archaeon]